MRFYDNTWEFCLNPISATAAAAALALPSSAVAPPAGNAAQPLVAWEKDPATTVSGLTVVKRQQREGRSSMRCIVRVTGKLDDCKLISEDPPGYGFGKAELELASHFKMKPAMRAGHAVEGLVTIPLLWKLAPEPAGPASAAPEAGNNTGSDR